MEWLAPVEQWRWVVVLRDSTWAYPFINSGHVSGIGLLIGAILPPDLRLLGLWADTPLWRVLARSAATALGVAASRGLPLFVTDARAYLGSPRFVGRLAPIGAGIVNALALRWRVRADIAAGRTTPRLKAAAPVSIGCGCGVLLLGRLVGYF